jgi:hypothetical protein
MIEESTRNDGNKKETTNPIRRQLMREEKREKRAEQSINSLCKKNLSSFTISQKQQLVSHLFYFFSKKESLSLNITSAPKT